MPAIARVVSRPVLTGLMLLSLALLAACGGGTKPAQPTQVAAKVNDGEISVHQVQLVLRRNPRLVAEHREAAGRKALDNLVEQELAAQAAREAGLETAPDVIQSIEAAKREALARAWQDRLAERATAASTDEVERYYDEHPALFAKRQIYSVQEYAVQVAGEQQAAVVAAIDATRSPQELRDVLNARGLRFNARPLVLPAEGVPLPVLDKLAAASPGLSVVDVRPAALQILHLVAAQPAPLERAQARSAIEAFLLNERRRQQVEQGMTRLRQAARVEYVGSFAAAASAAQ
ncbi:EpsD family peptidyl-prolyl cis-trans isomerase [Schlegelella sp. S2-27]|uniref:peptidylprolyl isomerase n=1 Tax=Caldimonas mangrovi TaxID=2944811 RepID=A0ABT0YKJ8_9BURK|nr:EpsD family peptidyl-prolyl cis-trans isomerase [Caldimonas mangrovi]MCM5679267.1 EpsD family peptidyl-prolyl cis-trans isomerase [Caldimonas mangrovi]